MGVCAFVASALNFDADRYLENSPFKAMAAFRKGEVPPEDNPKQADRDLAKKRTLPLLSLTSQC